jgi:hypothetical protein
MEMSIIKINPNKLCLQFKCLKKEQGNLLITRK